MKTKLFSLWISTQLSLIAAGPAGEGYVAHEWGTFTSVQGADGISLEWNPLVTTELPQFVYDLNHPDRPGGSSGDGRAKNFSVLGSKSAFMALQRMETPVIYFYSDREREVDVRVRFPQGLITEWFPQASIVPNDSFGTASGGKSDRSLIRWNAVRLQPTRDQSRPAPVLPTDGTGSHYYAARATDADVLTRPANSKSGAKQESEKFLFYRGLGFFQAPLRFSLDSSDETQLHLRNEGAEDLTHLFVLSVRQGQGRFAPVERIRAHGAIKVRFDRRSDLRPLSAVVEDLGRRMHQALIADGLYAREAAAMIQTWRDAWFEEEGFRVLYVLPRPWTDRTLPIDFKPSPRELVRVMVGRAEMITPESESQLRHAIALYRDGDVAAQAAAVEQVRATGLGRFAEAAMRRFAKQNADSVLSRVSWELLEAAFNKPAKKSSALVAQ